MDGIIQRWYYSNSSVCLFWGENMDDIIRIIKLLENLGILNDGVCETVKHEIKRQKGRFFVMLLGTLGALMPGNMFTEKGFLRAAEGVVRAGRWYR